MPAQEERKQRDSREYNIMQPFRPIPPEPPSPAPRGWSNYLLAAVFGIVAIGLYALFEHGFIGETALLVMLVMAAALVVVVISWFEWAAAFEVRTHREVPPPFDVLAIWPPDEIERRLAGRRSPGAAPADDEGRDAAPGASDAATR
jgi:hypothetical protein